MVANISTIKKELALTEKSKLTEVVLRLAKYKADNKALITYLLFDKDNEQDFIENVKIETEDNFRSNNIHHPYYFKKGLRKIIRSIDKYIRFSTNKDTEVQLRLYLLSLIIENGVNMNANTVLTNMYNGQLKKIDAALSRLHEDLQFDYKEEIETAHQYIKERSFYL